MKNIFIFLILIWSNPQLFSQSCTINAGSNVTICGTTHTLNGSVGGSSVGNPTWSIVSKPSGAPDPIISNVNSLTPNVTGMTSPGNYVFQISQNCSPTGTATSQITITAPGATTGFTAGADITTIPATTGVAVLNATIPDGYTASWTYYNINSFEFNTAVVTTNATMSGTTTATPTLTLTNNANHTIDPAYRVTLRITSINNPSCWYEDDAIVRFIPNPIVSYPDNRSFCGSQSTVPINRYFYDPNASSARFSDNTTNASANPSFGTTITMTIISQPPGGNLAYDRIHNGRLYFAPDFNQTTGPYVFTLTITNAEGTYTTQVLTFNYNGPQPEPLNFVDAAYPEQMALYSAGNSAGAAYCNTAGTTTPITFYYKLDPADSPTLVSTVTAAGIIPPGGAPSMVLNGAGTLDRSVTLTPPPGGWSVGTYRFTVNVSNGTCNRSSIYYVHISDGNRPNVEVNNLTVCYPGSGTISSTIPLPAVYQGVVNSSYFQGYSGSYELTVVSKPAGSANPVFDPVSLRTFTNTSTVISNLNMQGEYVFRIKAIPSPGGDPGFIENEYICSGTSYEDTFSIFLSTQVNSNAGSDQSISCTTSVSLNGNDPGVSSSGLWTLIAKPQGAPDPVITNPALQNTTLTGLTSTGAYTFRWTVTTGNCTSFDDVAVILDSTSCPLPCDGTAYLLNGPNSAGQLFKHNLATGITDPTPLASFGGLSNGLGFSPIDSTLWLLVTTPPITAAARAKLTRVDGAGIVTTFDVPNLPTALGVNPSAGGITPTGYYVAKTSTSSSGGPGDGTGLDGDNFVVIDINPSRSTYLQIVDPSNSYALATAPYYKETVGNMGISMADFAFNTSDGLFYGVNPASNLVTLNIATNTYTVGNILDLSNGTLPASATYNSTYIDGNGFLYAIDENGNTYKISIPSGDAVLISQMGALSNGDGANCSTAILAHSIQGNVFIDGNGLIDNIVNGTPTNLSNTLNAVLYNNTIGEVAAINPVATNGTFAFGAIPGDSYSIYATTNTATVGQTSVPVLALPSGYIYTGEFNCVTTSGCIGNDGTPNGILSLGAVNGEITQANFGILDSDADSDGDGVTNGDEITDGTDANNPCDYLTASQTVTPIALYSLDSDGDGISDFCDLDDDNDGILDTVECSNTYNDMIAAYGGGETVTIIPSMFGLGLGDLNQNVSADLSHLYGYPASSGAVIVTINNASVHPTVPTAWWTKDGEAPSDWTITGSMSAFIIMAHDTRYYGSDSKTFHIYDLAPVIPITVPGLENQVAVPGVWQPVETTLSKTLNYLSSGELFANWRFINMNFGDKSFGFSTTVATADPTYEVLMYLECDVDMDGIPNRLDLDSDNDGCYDAIEGDENVLITHLTSGEINGTVDANGVPNLVNSGGSSDIGGDQGQGIGQAYIVNPTITTPTVYSVTPPTCLADGFATVSGYNATFSYIFSPSGPSVNPTTGVVSGTTPGTGYSLVVVSAGGCAADTVYFTTAAMLVTPAAPSVTVVPAVCGVDGTASIDAYDSSLTYSFSPATVGMSVDASGNILNALFGTAYTVTVDNGSCTTAGTTFTIDEDLVNDPLLDCDGDGVTNGTEVTDGTDPQDPCDYLTASQTVTPSNAWNALDCDGDGVTNGTEVTDGTDPQDPCDYLTASQTLAPSTAWNALDCDGDGVTNGTEVTDGTDPQNPCDHVTASQTLAPSTAWNALDCDGDGVTNGTEVTDGTNSQDPCDYLTASQTVTPSTAWNALDCDGDGVTNGTEVTDGTDSQDPCDYLTASQTVTPSTAWNALDCDGDGVTNGTEVTDGTDPQDPCDYLTASQTVTPSTAWNALDCDGDGVTNGTEVTDGTDPNDPCDYLTASQTLAPSTAWNALDCDGDGVTNGTEVTDGTDPNDPCDYLTASQTVTPSTAWNALDCDGDGVTNGTEVTDGTDPQDPCDYLTASQTVTPSTAWNALDCDGDGVTNGTEVTDGTDPQDPCDYLTTSQTVTPSTAWNALDCDGDGVTNGTEVTDGTDSQDPCDYLTASQTLAPSTAWNALDCDGDGVTNGTEVTDGTDPQDPCDYLTASQTVTPSTAWNALDCDGDGVTNGTEVTDGTDPQDPCDYLTASQTVTPSNAWNALDCDGDGVTNGTEVTDGTDPQDPCDYLTASQTVTPSTAWNALDCDGDGVTNGTEVTDGTDPNDPCDYLTASQTLAPSTAWNALDCDGDGVTNGTEVTDGTDPQDPCDYLTASQTVTPSTAWNALDCDGDGVTNGTEVTDGTDPQDPCDYLTASQTVTPSNAWNALDCDGDGVTNGTEVTDGTDPQDPCDYLTASQTVTPSTAWNALDCDGDGVTNGTEVTDGTDPNDPCDYLTASQTLAPSTAWNALDCDGDGVTNGTEVTDGTDPNDPCDYLTASQTVAPSTAWNALDCDGDGVTNGTEVTDGTDPNDPCDYLTASQTLAPSTAWNALDCDGDGVTNGTEVTDGTDPQDPCDYLTASQTLTPSNAWNALDCDGDGVTNEDEVTDGTDPNDPCDYLTASQTVAPSTAWNALDCDGDGVTNEDEVTDGTDPNDPCDFETTSITLTQNGDWLTADCDGDGVTNEDEVTDGTDPYDPCDFILSSQSVEPSPEWNAADCDGDGITNEDEVTDGTDPQDPCDPLKCGGLDVWNAFTPDGDGVNDTWTIVGIENYPDNEVLVFNRWGNVVFSAKGYLNTWDGTSNNELNVGGDQLPTGTYYYILETKDETIGVLKGYVYIQR